MTENEAIRDLEYLIEEYSAYPPETGVNETIGSLQYCITALREIQQYREIGTVEECREAVEKQKAESSPGARKRNGELSVENRKCESCVYFDKNTDNQTGICRKFECRVNKNQCCQWYVKRLDK